MEVELKIKENVRSGYNHYGHLFSEIISRTTGDGMIRDGVAGKHYFKIYTFNIESTIKASMNQMPKLRLWMKAAATK